MLPAVKEKYQKKYKQLQEQVEKLKDSLTSQLDESKKYALELEIQNQTLMN